MENISIDHVLQVIAIVVSITSLIIGATCVLILKWISGMCDEVKQLRVEFAAFAKEYYEKHAEVQGKDECIRIHGILDHKVDVLHERVDAMELDRR